VIKMAKKPESLRDNMYGMGWELMPRTEENAYARNQGP
jgi:hypothetical protein